MLDAIGGRTVELFFRLGWTKLLMSMDCDDTMWGLLEHVCNVLGIDFLRASAVFDLAENSLISDEEREALIAAFADAQMFENMQFYPGVEDIIKVQETGALLQVKSNAYTKRVGKLKKEQILAAVPGLRPEQVEITVIDHSQCKQKAIDPHTAISVDDNPHVVAASPALLNVVPATMRRVTNTTGIRIMEGKRVVLKRDLITINAYTYDICAAIQQEAVRRGMKVS